MKKLIVTTDLIKKATAKLGAAVSSKVVPALENIYCKAVGKSLHLTTCDTEMTIKYTIPVESEEDAEFLLHYQPFVNIIKICRDETIELEILKASVKIKAGTDVFTLKFNAKVEEFPQLKEIPSKHQLILDDTSLPIISAAAESVSKDELRPSLCRVCLDISPDKVNVVGTDAWIIYKYSLPTGSDTPTQLLLSARMVKAIEDLKKISIKWDDKKFCFESENISVVITQPNFKYPNYNAVINESPSNLKVKKANLIDTFRKLSISKNKDAIIQLTDKLLKAEVSDRDSGLKVNAEIPCEYSGDVPEIVLNSDYALRLLHQTVCEDLTISIQGPTKAVIVKGEDPNYLALIIPTFNK